MSPQLIEAKVPPDAAETAPAELSRDAAAPEAAVTPPAIRYMDDATFRRCLQEVVTVHDRLLSKLAE